MPPAGGKPMKYPRYTRREVAQLLAEALAQGAITGEVVFAVIQRVWPDLPADSGERYFQVHFRTGRGTWERLAPRHSTLASARRAAYQYRRRGSDTRVLKHWENQVTGVLVEEIAA
jgi:hypothetical protein